MVYFPLATSQIGLKIMLPQLFVLFCFSCCKHALLSWCLEWRHHKQMQHDINATVQTMNLNTTFFLHVQVCEAHKGSFKKCETLSQNSFFLENLNKKMSKSLWSRIDSANWNRWFCSLATNFQILQRNAKVGKRSNQIHPSFCIEIFLSKKN